jgi:hypothetical protein
MNKHLNQYDVYSEFEDVTDILQRQLDRALTWRENRESFKQRYLHKLKINAMDWCAGVFAETGSEKDARQAVGILVMTKGPNLPFTSSGPKNMSKEAARKIIDELREVPELFFKKMTTCKNFRAEFNKFAAAQNAIAEDIKSCEKRINLEGGSIASYAFALALRCRQVSNMKTCRMSTRNMTKMAFD